MYNIDLSQITVPSLEIRLMHIKVNMCSLIFQPYPQNQDLCHSCHHIYYKVINEPSLFKKVLKRQKY